MKKFFYLFVCFVMTCAFIGCGNKSTKAEVEAVDSTVVEVVDTVVVDSVATDTVA